MRKGVVSINYGDAAVTAEGNIENQNENELFVDHRRGEVNDLYEKLQDITLIKDREKRIELFQKAIALMTLGVDVSSLYSLMILASATHDQVEKKIIYLYLTHYAERNSELALLMVNTLRKDSEDEDPVIRSLALRSFSSLKIPIAIEYIEPILRNGLNDSVGYVRKTAVMGCLKFFQYSKNNFLNTNLLETLTYMLDTELDPSTIINLVYVLNEINKETGGATFTKQFILKILTNIKSFNEWSQYHILQLIFQNLSSIVQQDQPYPLESTIEEQVPSSDVFQILNSLEEVIRHSSVNVLLISIQIFISLTKAYPKLFSQVVQRIKSPLFTHASTSIPEISVIVYSHMRLLFSFFSNYSKDGIFIEEPNRTFYSSSSILSYYYNEYKLLMSRNGDPYYIQDIKLDLIPFLSSEENTKYILEELYHYSYELGNPSLIHKSIYLMSVLIIKYIQIRLDSTPEDLKPSETLKDDHIIKAYINFSKDLMESEKEQILSPILMGLELVSESFPWAIEELIGRYFQISLIEKLSFKTGGICSFLWIMAKFPDYVYCDKAEILDYIITNLIDVFEKNSDNIESLINRPSNLFSILITSCCRLLFDSPEDVRPILGRLLEFSIERMDYPDVKDLALFYYRLLQFDYKIARTVIQDDSGEYMPKGKYPPSIYILKDYFFRWKNDNLFQEFNTCSIVSEHYKQMGVKFDFFGHCLCNETEAQFGDSKSIENIKTITGNSSKISGKSTNLRLKQSVFMEPDEFERLWNKLKESLEIQEEMDCQTFENFEFMSSFEDDLGKEGIICIASGEIDEKSFKLFTFCVVEDLQNSLDLPCLCEITLEYSISKRVHHVSAQIKVDTQDLTDLNTSSYCNYTWSWIRRIFDSNLIVIRS
ncbi:beta-adaptin AP complex subunit-related protein [Cryptosporidium ubiquitum]|uniref:Beta-adaptin AP complex subunit-related protein n=1 Tax=Cryptosporidium ubiquitum TaxID=857276 RepID=A0A1J4MIW9_9CRYT|nr:beta-adaptin AP complex subunit-related protein [Cryptosporidium ubiquitum]OII73411.1 beta-adaptin AP complex subunit-related protein [Cryptosporidium ubiquitum]